MAVQWEPRTDQPDTPDASRLWRGVRNALLIEAAALLIVIPIGWGLGWL